jgi:hypothetical protein
MTHPSNQITQVFSIIVCHFRLQTKSFVTVCILFLDYFFLFSGYDDDLLIPIMLSFVVTAVCKNPGEAAFLG